MFLGAALCCTLRRMQKSTIQPRRRLRRSRQERRRLVDLWRSAGEPRDSFCAAHDISLTSFSRWLAELPDEEQPATHADDRLEVARPAEFFEVRVNDIRRATDGAQEQPEVIVHDGQGLSVELRGAAARLVADQILARLRGGVPC